MLPFLYLSINKAFGLKPSANSSKLCKFISSFKCFLEQIQSLSTPLQIHSMSYMQKMILQTSLWMGTWEGEGGGTTPAETPIRNISFVLTFFSLSERKLKPGEDFIALNSSSTSSARKKKRIVTWYMYCHTTWSLTPRGQYEMLVQRRNGPFKSLFT